MSKNIKLIRAIFLVALCAMMVLSILDTHEIRRNTDFDQENILTHIENLTANGPRSIFDMEENQLAVKYITDTLDSWGLVCEDTTDVPAYMVHSYVGPESRYQNFYLDNVIVHIPANAAEPTGEAFMFMAHTDSVPMGDGASDDGVPVSVMMEAIRYYLNRMEQGFTMANDLVFCFVNGEEFGLIGSNAFMTEFQGFNNVVERIRFGTNLESRGTAGTLVMFETADNNYNTIKLFADVNDTVFTSSIATLVYSMMPNGTDFSNFKEVYQGLNMANIDGGQNYHTQNDKLENVGMSYLSQQAQMVDDLIEKLANADLDALDATDKAAIFFSYLNIATVVYDEIFAMVLALVLLALVVANVVAGRKYRKVTQTLKGLSVMALALAASAGAVLVCYYLFQYVAVLFGTIDVNMVGSITYANSYITISIGLIALAACVTVVRMANRWLGVTGRDLHRSFAYFHAVAGIVLTFVLPSASYLFAFSGLMFMVNELLVTLEWKRKEFHFELLAIALYTPIIMPILTLAITALGMTNAMIFGLVFVLGIFPLAVYATPIFGGLSLGRIFRKEGTPMGGVATVLLMATVICVAVCMGKPNASVNLGGKQNIIRLPYDDALVYVVDGENTEYRIYDLNAYPYAKAYADEMTFNGEYYSVPGTAEVSHEILSTAEGNVLTVTTTDPESLVYVTFTDIQAESFTIDDGKSIQTYVFDDSETRLVTIYDDCTVTLNGGSANVEYREVIRDYPTLMPAEDAGDLHFNLWMTTTYQLVP